MKENNHLTIITCAHNEYLNLKRQYKILKPQLSTQFRWVVKDSGRCKETENFFKKNYNPNIFFNNEKDSGLYEALNISLSYVVDYYMVFGASDIPNPQIIKKVLRDRKIEADFIHTAVEFGEKIKIPNPNGSIIFSLRNRVTSHSCGMIIKKSIHNSLGKYDTNYQILADYKFLLKSFKTADVKHLYDFKNFVTGRFSLDGISTDPNRIRILEAYRISKELRHFPYLQGIFYALRILKLFIHSIYANSKNIYFNR